jgi:hypothetical protein
MKRLLTVALVGATTLLASQTVPASAWAGAGAQGFAEHGATASVVMAASPSTQPLATKKGWKYRTYHATACYASGQPFFGKPNGARCAVAYATLSGVVAYNGKQAWGQFINSSGGGAKTTTVKTTWKGFVNNGAKAPLAGGARRMQIGANYHVDLTYTKFDVYIRISVYPNGTARLSGGRM